MLQPQVLAALHQLGDVRPLKLQLMLDRQGYVQRGSHVPGVPVRILSTGVLLYQPRYGIGRRSTQEVLLNSDQLGKRFAHTVVLAAIQGPYYVLTYLVDVQVILQQPKHGGSSQVIALVPLIGLLKELCHPGTVTEQPRSWVILFLVTGEQSVHGVGVELICRVATPAVRLHRHSTPGTYHCRVVQVSGVSIRVVALFSVTVLGAMLLEL